MKIDCFGCGAIKDTQELEISPFAEKDGLTDSPINPFLVLDVQGPRDANHHSEYRQTRVCHHCFHALSPDMWISENCWKQIKPVIPYDKLPMYAAETHDPTLLMILP